MWAEVRSPQLCHMSPCVFQVCTLLCTLVCDEHYGQQRAHRIGTGDRQPLGARRDLWSFLGSHQTDQTHTPGEQQSVELNVEGWG